MSHCHGLEHPCRSNHAVSRRCTVEPRGNALHGPPVRHRKIARASTLRAGRGGLAPGGLVDFSDTNGSNRARRSSGTCASEAFVFGATTPDHNEIAWSVLATCTPCRPRGVTPSHRGASRLGVAVHRSDARRVYAQCRCQRYTHALGRPPSRCVSACLAFPSRVRPFTRHTRSVTDM
jgi:hypothetical protein